MSGTTLKRTPLYSNHVAAGARMTEFGGWEMPVQYTGLIDEHNTVRSRAGLFDVSHMGEITVRGPKALAFLQRITSNDVSKLSPGKAHYSYIPNERGGVIDDIIVYQLAPESYLLCVNAGNTDKDWAWIQKQNSEGAEIANVSADYAQVALQGPVAYEILAKYLGESPGAFTLEEFPAFTVREYSLRSEPGKKIIVARTGYTGEDGFEIFCGSAFGSKLWDHLMTIGAPLGLKPCGLGARDTLRLEACFPLHGHELSDDITALESGLGWVTKFEKGAFVGSDILKKQKTDGLKRRLVGFELIDKGIVRADAPVCLPSGERIGAVSSGTMTPTLGKSVGLAFIDQAHSSIGTELRAEVRGKPLAIRIIKTPFYKRQA